MTKETINEYVRILLLSAVGSSALTFITCPSCYTELARYLPVTIFSFTVWVSLWIGNDKLTHFISTKISWVEAPLKRLIWGLISTVVYTLSAVLTITKLWEVIMGFDFDDYSIIILSSLIVTFLLSLFLHSREFLIQWKKSSVDAERLKKESVAAQYESLKSQVNPHFLFNSLNALTNLVYEDQGKAVTFIKQLSEVYRYVLDTREKEVVPIDEELRFLESYFFLQKIRFGENLKIENQLRSGSTMLVPLALQLLVENALKHNVVSAADPLTIKLYQDQDFVVVENSLRKKIALAENSNGIGIDNIKKRYQFLTNKEVLVIETGGKFIVKLPIIEIEKA
jgi:sensor histidine kinase YesM